MNFNDDSFSIWHIIAEFFGKIQIIKFKLKKARFLSAP